MIALVVLSFLLERSLSILFEHKTLQGFFSGKKEIIAFALAYLICAIYSFDILAVVFDSAKGLFGYLVTSMVVAGGSKGSLKLFQDVLKVGNISK